MEAIQPDKQKEIEKRVLSFLRNFEGVKAPEIKPTAKGLGVFTDYDFMGGIIFSHMYSIAVENKVNVKLSIINNKIVFFFYP